MAEPETWTLVCLFRHGMDNEDERTYLFRDEEIWPAFRQQLDEQSAQGEALLRIATGWGERWSKRAREEGCARKDIQRAEALAPVLEAREQELDPSVLSPPLLVSHVYRFLYSVPFEASFHEGDDLEEEQE